MRHITNPDISADPSRAAADYQQATLIADQLRYAEELIRQTAKAERVAWDRIRQPGGTCNWLSISAMHEGAVLRLREARRRMAALLGG